MVFFFLNLIFKYILYRNNIYLFNNLNLFFIIIINYLYFLDLKCILYSNKIYYLKV